MVGRLKTWAFGYSLIAFNEFNKFVCKWKDTLARKEREKFEN